MKVSGMAWGWVDGRVAALLLALLLFLSPRRSLAENRFEYRYEDYSEDRGRMQVQTHSVWFEYDLHEKVVARGSYVNDALAGATPTGGPGYPGQEFETVRMKDRRDAGFMEAAVRAGRTLTTPQISYSEESDYRSIGLSLTEAIDFNQRNTTLVLGVARNFDEVSGFWQRETRYKGTLDFLIGVNQVLGPRTVATLNLTLGYADGYLTDPYKGINFYQDLPPFGPYDPRDPNLDPIPFGASAPERRPSHKFRQMVFGSLTHYFAPMNAGAEASYRFHHDDWGVIAHTFQGVWNQKVGKRVVVSPLVRYHRQSAADFYRLRVNSDPGFGPGRLAFTPDNFFYAQEGDGVFESDVLTDPDSFLIVTVPAAPDAYSADYRLSELETWTVGMGMTVQLHDRIALQLAYKRYVMKGRDGITPAGIYPDAHIATVGMSASF
jgi:hypothetical protein